MRYLPLAVIVLAGVALRLWLIAINPADPRFSSADDGDYYRRALRLAVTGQYIDDAWLIRPPLHVFFFAGWLRLALVAGVPQHGVLLVQLAQVVVGALTTLLGYGIARRMFASRTAGYLFAAFLALWFPFVEMPSVLFSELLYTFLFLLHFWLLLRFDASGRLLDLALSGLALGAAALTRSPALYSLAFVALWLLLRRPTADDGRQPPPLLGRWSVVGRRWSSALRQTILVAVCCLAVVGPWTARNYVVYQRFIPVDTLGPINLWLDLEDDTKRDSKIARLRELPQADRQAYASERVRRILADDPLRPFWQAWPTFRHVWKAQYVEDYLVKQSFFARPLRTAAPLGLAGDVLWLVFTLAGLVGLAGPLREGLHTRLFVLSWLAYSLLTVLVFHVEPRYLIPIWTLIALYGAGTLAGLHRRRTTEDRRPTTSVRTLNVERLNGGRWSLPLQLAVAVTFVFLLLSYRDYPAIFARGFARERAMVAGERSYLAGDYATAAESFRAALAAQPEFVDARVQLALALIAQDRRDEAATLLNRRDSRRGDLVLGTLWRDAGDLRRARTMLNRVEETAGEDIQRWSLAWLRPAATAALRLGDGLDLGYLDGFSAGEGAPEGSFRWLEGEGTLALPLTRPLEAGSTLTLRAVSGRPEDVPLRVQIGDGPQQEVMVRSGQWRSYRFQVPPELVGQQVLAVRLEGPTFIPARLDPASADSRTLSLMVSEVRVR